MTYFRILLPAALLLAWTGGLAFAADEPDTRKLSEVVASQGGADVTLGYVDAFAAQVPEKDRAQLFYSAKRVGQIVAGLLATRQQANEARESGLAENPKVQALVQLAVDRVLSQARAQQLHDQLAEQVPDMASLAHERYLANPSAFNQPRRVDVRHILISTKDRDDAAAKALADQLYAQLQADPGKFVELVDEYSDDPSKVSNHGLIENAASSRTVKEFSEASGSLSKVGEITGPVKTMYGYHIIQAEKIVPARPRPFAEVKDDLETALREDWIAQRVKHHSDVLRNKAITENEALVEALRTRYAGDKLDILKTSTGTAKPAPAASAASKAAAQ